MADGGRLALLARDLCADPQAAGGYDGQLVTAGSLGRITICEPS